MAINKTRNVSEGPLSRAKLPYPWNLLEFRDVPRPAVLHTFDRG